MKKDNGIREYNAYTIRYTYNNGFRGSQKILSRCKNTERLKEIISIQLSRANRAKFKVIVDKNKIVNGWLLNMDVKNFSIE